MQVPLYTICLQPAKLFVRDLRDREDNQVISPRPSLSSRRFSLDLPPLGPLSKAAHVVQPPSVSDMGTSAVLMSFLTSRHSNTGICNSSAIRGTSNTSPNGMLLSL